MAAVVLAAVNLAWNLGSPVAPAAFPRPGPQAPLRLTGVHWEPGDDAETLVVEITVRNVDARRRRGLVWWQLAPEAQPAPRRSPWPRRAYESRYLDVDLAGDAEATYRWTEVPGVPAGTYAVHGWTRVAAGDSFRPSDGRQVTAGTVTIARTPTLLRHRPVPTDAEVTRVDARPGRGSLRGVVGVRNLTDRARHGWLAWTVSPSSGGDLLYWWRWAGTTAEPRYREIELRPREEIAVELLAPPPAAGRYALRVSLEFDDVEPAPSGAVTGDDVVVLVDVDPRGVPVAGGRRP